MEEADRISGEQGSVKPEETLTDIVRQVAFARADGERGAMRAAANGAFMHWLAQFACSDVDQDQEILEFALKQQGFDSWEQFRDAFHQAGEPAMVARKRLEEAEHMVINDETEFELQEPGGGDGKD